MARSARNLGFQAGTLDATILRRTKEVDILRLAVLACLVASSVTAPSEARAQVVEERPSVVERWHPEAFPAREPEQQSAEAPRDLALVLKLDDAGLRMSSVPERGADRLALEEAHLNVRRARIGVGVSVVGIGVGTALFFGSLAASICFGADCPPWRRTASGIAVGSTLMVGGFVGMILSAVILRRRKRDSERLNRASSEAVRRAAWDPVGSRLVF